MEDNYGCEDTMYLTFVPDYLANASNDYKQVSSGDSIALYVFDIMMTRSLITQENTSLTYTKCLDWLRNQGEYVSEAKELYNYYLDDSEKIFTPEAIKCGNGEPVFDIKIDYEGNTVYVICKTGSTSLLEFNTRKKVTSWLMGYFVNELGEERFLKSDFFKRYWFKM